MKGADTNRLTVTFTPPAGSGGEFEATVAWLGSNLLSEVRRGENAGRRLRHNFVVLRTAASKLKPADGSFTATVPLLRPDERDSERLALAAWVSRRGEQAPVQAVGGWWASGK